MDKWSELKKFLEEQLNWLSQSREDDSTTMGDIEYGQKQAFRMALNRMINLEKEEEK